MNTDNLIPGMDMSQFQGPSMDFEALSKVYKFMIHHAFVGNAQMQENFERLLKDIKEGGAK